MKVTAFIIMFLFVAPLLGGCSQPTVNEKNLIEKQLNEITAAKTPFGLTKEETPIFNTYDIDAVFGGPNGDSIQYDHFGEIDQLQFVAPVNTLFFLQRQIRLKTRAGAETIYYKGTSPLFPTEESLWIDGRFLHLEDIRPEIPVVNHVKSAILEELKTYQGLPYTWHGTSPSGSSQLLEFYPPKKSLTKREKDDWIVKGFDSLGMLFRATGGATPISFQGLQKFGNAVFLDLSKIPNTDGKGNIQDASSEKAKLLMASVKPLDIIGLNERVFIVLDDNKVIESKYRGKFDGSVQITPLYDTLVGLFQKATFVENPLSELSDKNAKKFFVRRFFTDEKPSVTEESSPPPSTLDSGKVE